VRLSDLLYRHNIADYALVCDIEGAEAGFINLDEEALRGCKTMVVELHDTEFSGDRVSVGELCDRLVARHGFALVDRRSNVFCFSRSRQTRCGGELEPDSPQVLPAGDPRSARISRICVVHRQRPGLDRVHVSLSDRSAFVARRAISAIGSRFGSSWLSALPRRLISSYLARAPVGRHRFRHINAQRCVP
jgi:hypothetical protein